MGQKFTHNVFEKMKIAKGQDALKFYNLIKNPELKQKTRNWKRSDHA